MNALDEKDQKRQEKEQAKAVKTAQSDEKAVRKAKKAEEKSLKVCFISFFFDWRYLLMTIYDTATTKGNLQGTQSK